MKTLTARCWMLGWHGGNGVYSHTFCNGDDDEKVENKAMVLIIVVKCIVTEGNEPEEYTTVESFRMFVVMLRGYRREWAED